ncbi:hypothetical protein [Thiomicrorhabdus cannonii]|uniref:hypothetical protein n=1 Tax=Thiomicrorhabdus cannonii TaxID=2748011 RepID=UPI0015BBD396|nr:hypothetical protein [Thiomicrorhabdus cannonii]
MGSLTLRLDEETEALLTHFSEVLQQNKSTLARAGIVDYLNRQKALEEQKALLGKQIAVSSKEAAAQRIAESEASYQLSDEEYEHAMDEFFANELGLIR